MDIDSMISRAAREPLNAEVVQQACEGLGMPAQEILDTFAKKVADSFLAGHRSWEECDLAINSLYSYAYAFSDECMSEYAWRVFIAFDEGEYVHCDTPELNGENRTRRLLLELQKEEE